MIFDLFNKIKYGCKIDENMYLSARSKDELIVTYNNKKVLIYNERLGGKPDRVIYINKNSTWLEPYDQEKIQEIVYKNIIDAIVKHFNKLGEEIIVE